MDHHPPARRWRTAAVATTLSLALVLGPACGRLSRKLNGGGAPPTRKGTLTVSPASGPVGSVFSLTAGAFRPGEAMTFEIDIPGKPIFVGPPHPAAPDGTVTTTYTPLKGDPPGTYQIKATGNLGTRAQATLTVTG